MIWGQRFGPEINTSPPLYRHLFSQQGFPGATQAGSGRETLQWGAQRQAKQTHAWLQEAWLKRQLKMKLPSLSSSRDVKEAGSLDRMLM